VASETTSGSSADDEGLGSAGRTDTAPGRDVVPEPKTEAGPDAPTEAFASRAPTSTDQPVATTPDPPAANLGAILKAAEAAAKAAADATRAAQLAVKAAQDAKKAIDDATGAASTTVRTIEDAAPERPPPVKPKRVVIVGGGCAGMAAAWELAKQDGYEIHVYEKTPRLGGKGSSTRLDDGSILEHGLHVWMGWYENAFRMMRECYDIVEEKGYGPGKPEAERLAHGRFDDAFMAEPNIGLVDPSFHGKSVMWSVMFPPNEGRPGTPMTAHDNPFSIASYTLRMMEMAKAEMLSIVADMPGPTPGPARPDARSRSDEILSLDIMTPPADSTAALLNRVASLSKAGALTGAAALLQLVTMLEVWLRRQNIGPKAPESTLAIAEAATSQLRKLLRDVTGMDPRLRMKTETIDIVLTIMIGLFTDRVMFHPDGLDSLNDYDYREWLRLHGATRTSLESRFIRSAYDFAFAYEDGDLNRPRLAAGVALRGGLRMFFTYRGAAFYRMRSGMGDAIFAPLYRVLQDWEAPTRNTAGKAEDFSGPASSKLKSKVTFFFGHELERAVFDKDGGSLASLTFRGEAPTEKPLEWGGWPASNLDRRRILPRLLKQEHGQAEGENLKRLHRRGGSTVVDKDNDIFDLVIIATGIEEFREIFVCPHATGDEGFDCNKQSDDRDERAEEPPQESVAEAATKKPVRPAPYDQWATTCELTKTTATKAAQVWLPKRLYDLGWRHGSGLFACLGEGNFDTYAEMTHLIPAELNYVWRAETATDGAAAIEGGSGGAGDGGPGKWQSIAYFCNPAVDTIQDGPIPGDPGKSVSGDLRKLLTDQMEAFWPNLFVPKEPTLAGRERVYDGWVGDPPTGGPVQVYFRVNKEGSERYTLSVPGSIASRISPLDPGIDNMTVAGDWTACSLDCGCVEAAVMSGMLAATAISGRPKLSDIVGYDHP